MPLGLGSNLSKTGLTTPGIVTDNLVLKHNYNAGSVIPCSDGAAYLSNGQINVGNSNNFITGNNVTMAAWVKLINTDRGYVIGNARASGSSNLSLSVNANEASASAGWITVILRLSSSTVFVKYDGNIDDNKWHHIAFTTSDSAQALYLDGALVVTGSNAFSNQASTEDMLIGNLDSQTLYFDGYIANTAIWSSVLTQPQIKSIMNKNYAGLTDSEKTNLVSWWNLDSAYDSSVFDNHHGNGNTLGSELIISPWSSSVNWVINGYEATHTPGASNSLVESSSLTIGKTYKFEYTVSGRTAGSVRARAGSGTSGEYISTNISVTEYLKCSGNDEILFTPSSDFDGTLSNVSVKEVNGNTGTLT